jgi:hypothetical protein
MEEFILFMADRGITQHMRMVLIDFVKNTKPHKQISVLYVK